MGSSLPVESAADKAVQEFGIGTYDSDNGTGMLGEDSEGVRSEKNPRGKSLPDAGGSPASLPETLQSYPGSFASAFREAMLALRRATGMLPGDVDAGTTHQHPDTGRVDSVVPSTAQSKLPSDEDNPSARSDYYDRMTVGLTGDEWAGEDSGAYASSELPGEAKNEVTVDNGLSGAGNAWSGTVTQDQSGEAGHPTDSFRENVDYLREDLLSGGEISIASEAKMRKTATNHELVGQLAQSFLKKYGRKDLTRRHVMAFLTSEGQHQYLASDVIRCLKLRHSVLLKDVLDEFPAIKTASGLSMASVRDRLIELESVYVAKPEVAYHLRRCAASISQVIADLERFEGRNG